MTINDHKYQISTGLPTRAGMFDPLLNCLICLPAAGHLLIFVTNTGSPHPLVTVGGEGVNNLPVVPGLYFAACHKADLWLVTQGQGPWTCLCDQSKLCVTPGATNNKYLWRCWQTQWQFFDAFKYSIAIAIYFFLLLGYRPRDCPVCWNHFDPGSPTWWLETDHFPTRSKSTVSLISPVSSHEAIQHIPDAH